MGNRRHGAWIQAARQGITTVAIPMISPAAVMSFKPSVSGQSGPLWLKRPVGIMSYLPGLAGLTVTRQTTAGCPKTPVRGRCLEAPSLEILDPDGHLRGQLHAFSL